MMVDDLFTLEQLGSVSASPDGKWIAVVIARARTSAETYGFLAAGDVDHADIWLVSRHGGNRRNITKGLRDRRGYWNPVWSPDSRRLAMLSTRGGDRIQPYVWDMATDSVRRLTAGNADLEAYADQSFLSYSMIWSDSTTLLCPVKAEDAPPAPYTRAAVRPYARMVEVWSKTAAGMEPSVSVLESGTPAKASRPLGQLLAIDVTSGRSRVIVEANFRQFLVSPSGRHLALIAETGRIPPRPDRKIPYLARFRELWRTRLFMLSLDKELRGKWVDGVIDPKFMAEDAPQSWSSDGSLLAVVSKDNQDDETASTLWVVSASTAAARQVTGPELEASASAWSRDGDLLALARERSCRELGHPLRRDDWWKVGLHKRSAPAKLTSQLSVVPQSLMPAPFSENMVGIAGGDLWLIDVRSRRVTNATEAFDPRIERQVWPTGIRRSQRYGEETVVQTTDSAMYRLNWNGSSLSLRELPRPEGGAELIEFRPQQGLTIFAGKKFDGTFVWASEGTGARFEELVALNTHVGGLADPKRMLIEYRGADGDTLKALLILPIGYQQGTRYPLVTWVYPDWRVTDTSYAFWLYDKQSVSSINLNLLVSHGVGLLIPSLPLPPDGQAGDPYLELPKGVMPAVERAIELGIADPERLAVMGLSFGGYATYSLVTYTHRFKAAIAIAGFSDLISDYGEFLPGQRYHDYAHQELFAPALAESGQLRMGGPPWADLFRYVRNSPISFADRVKTPLMIIQGDMDYVSITNGEEFFTAMYRLGKRAELVRYWGEGHTIESPANVRDMWQRLFAWLDENFTKSGS